MDVGNMPGAQEQQVRSSKEAKNRNIGADKLLEVALF